MPKLIIDGVITDGDNTQFASLEQWQASPESLSAVQIEPGEGIEALFGHLDKLTAIAINFPVFSDGRGYSYARELRDTHGYKGEIRAVGDVLKDQLFFLKRCGFNAFAPREDRDIEVALASLQDFTDSYQGDTLDPAPSYQR